MKHIPEERIARARQLVAEIHHVPLATVNQDGTPHNSPVFMAFDEALNGFWASNQETQHSKNIARAGRVFLVVFDSREGHGGLYIEAHAKVLETASEIEHGYQTLKELKAKAYGGLGDPELYLGDSPQRIYQAIPKKFWVNNSERNEEGFIIRDYRVAISLQQLKEGEDGRSR
jgi:general stress protein 26